MVNETQIVVDKLKDYYGVSDEALDVDTENGWITLNDTAYIVHPGLTDSEIEDLVSYIASREDLYENVKTEESYESFSSDDIEKEEVEVSEDLEEDAQNDGYPSLLVALDSEKDAIVTYETLINIEETSEDRNQEVIDLLSKILVDEKEHIALLSALQAKNISKFVADDSQEDFSTYVEDAQEDVG